MPLSMNVLAVKSRIVKGPNKSIDVEYQGGAGLSRSLGRFPITCPDSFLSSSYMSHS